ncbi:MAG: hypothetical protein CVV47_04465 [Spirochaetae bacterium HGW-Spirochaetae-3]|jgi:lipopolysaccharide export system protein LptA|nr:MAG: hypothetical protein CVV47_04465 [Spirochaetae bacterium HGW-Spirochaetae-3]
MTRLRLALAAVLAIATAVPPAFADDFSFSADSMTGAMSKGRERATLVGNAVVVSGGMRISADRIELYGDEFRFVECKGRVAVTDEERGLRLTTERLSYDRRDKVSRLTGPSVMEDRLNKVVIKGDYIENDDERKIAIVQINVRILKENLSCRAEFARYDRAAKSLELSGSPTVRRDGDEYRAATILVDLDTEDIVLVGTVSGTVAAGKKKEPPPEPGEPLSVPAEPSSPGATP